MDDGGGTSPRAWPAPSASTTSTRRPSLAGRSFRGCLASKKDRPSSAASRSRPRMPTRSTGAAASTGGCSYAPSSPHTGALSRPARPTSTGATAMRRGSQVSWPPAHAPPRCSSWAISTRPSSRRESGTSSPRSVSSTPSERPTPPRRASRSGSPCGSSAHSRRGAWTSSCSPPARTPAPAWSRAASSSTSRAARRAGCSGHRTTTGCCPRWRFSGARVMGRQGPVGREPELHDVQPPSTAPDFLGHRFGLTRPGVQKGSGMSPKGKMAGGRPAAIGSGGLLRHAC